ncbi:MAG: hypothetical protein KatS3mg078_0967 [Deltaproteobacteria bacterium]|jgi:hypothetical protein|nr:MAG: hypothetical protein KatS3mg078_0967 [Deltaproteobacteria bacterium]
MGIFNKILRALSLDTAFYEEIEKDTEATGEAFIVVVIGGVCSGIGLTGILGVRAAIAGLVSGVIGWFIWSLVIFLIGVKVFKHTSDLGELLRTLGFAYSPSVFALLGLIPKVGTAIYTITTIWYLLAFIVAVRQSLDCETGRAIFISLMGFIVYWCFRIALLLV